MHTNINSKLYDSTDSLSTVPTKLQLATVIYFFESRILISSVIFFFSLFSKLATAAAIAS